MIKTIEDLKKLNTKRLLSYYRAERKRYDVSKSEYHHDFDCVGYIWDHSDDEYYQDKKVKYLDWWIFLCEVKTELDSRENIS